MTPHALHRDGNSVDINTHNSDGSLISKADLGFLTRLAMDLGMCPAPEKLIHFDLEIKKCFVKVASSAQLKGIASSTPVQQAAGLVSVTAHDTVTSSGPLFTYSYTLSNQPPDTALISKVDLDITVPPGGTSLSRDGLQNGQGFMQDLADAVLHDPRTPVLVPVALSAPGGWLTTVSVAGTASWIAQSDDAAIFVGGSNNGYQITSPGLPAIRNLNVEADYDVNTLPLLPPADPGDIHRYDNDLSEVLKNFRATTITVGPSSPPADFQPIQFLQTIQSYKEQAFKQGWIDNAGVANSLDAKLNAALGALQGQDTNTARNVLNALLNEVEAQAEQHLTPEGVALLQFNTQYLLSKFR